MPRENDCCNLHNAGCIIQVAGHVLWPRAAWLYQEAVTHKKASLLTRPNFKGNSGLFNTAIKLVQALFENCLE